MPLQVTTVVVPCFTNSITLGLLIGFSDVHALADHLTRLTLSRKDFTFGLTKIFPSRRKKLSLKSTIYLTSLIFGWDIKYFLSLNLKVLPPHLRKPAIHTSEAEPDIHGDEIFDLSWYQLYVAEKRKIKTHEYLEIEKARASSKPIPVFLNKTGTGKYRLFNQVLKGECVPSLPKKQHKPTGVVDKFTSFGHFKVLQLRDQTSEFDSEEDSNTDWRFL